MDEGFARVAALIVQGDPPQWLTQHLKDFAPFIGLPYNSGKDDDLEGRR